MCHNTWCSDTYYITGFNGDIPVCMNVTLHIYVIAPECYVMFSIVYLRAVHVHIRKDVPQYLYTYITWVYLSCKCSTDEHYTTTSTTDPLHVPPYSSWCCVCMLHPTAFYELHSILCTTYVFLLRCTPCTICVC